MVTEQRLIAPRRKTLANASSTGYRRVHVQRDFLPGTLPGWSRGAEIKNDGGAEHPYIERLVFVRTGRKLAGSGGRVRCGSDQRHLGCDENGDSY